MNKDEKYLEVETFYKKYKSLPDDEKKCVKAYQEYLIDEKKKKMVEEKEKSKPASNGV